MDVHIDYAGRVEKLCKAMESRGVDLTACEVLVASLKAGSTIGDVFKKVSDELSRSDYRRYTLPGFGHGLGVVGHEWHPPSSTATRSVTWCCRKTWWRSPPWSST
jgi:hypothetical protein